MRFTLLHATIGYNNYDHLDPFASVQQNNNNEKKISYAFEYQSIFLLLGRMHEHVNN